MSNTTLPSVFFETVKNYGSKISLQTKTEGEYRGISYDEMGKRVKNLALGLASFGIKKGDKVSILAENRAEWAISDLAILSLGAINVPIYPTLTPHQVEFILKDADVKILIASTSEQVDKISQIFDNLPFLTRVIYIDKFPNPQEYMSYFKYINEKGSEFDKQNPGYFDKTIKAIEPNDTCAIVYTSGTTGNPKGVILSHNNILSNVQAGVDTLHVRSTDQFLSFLPLCHVFERMAGQFCPFLAGSTIAYAESIETVAQNLMEVKPTIMCSVPRLFEKIYVRILENAEAGSPLKKRIFYWALKIGQRYSDAEKKGRISTNLKLKHNIASKLVFSKIQAKVGGNLRYFVSGGAPLSKEIGQFFDAVGVKILEGYGLTETSPVITINLEEKYKFGTVGPALTQGGVELKIADDGEILTKGPHVMEGYYNNPQATQEIIDTDGWLHTGDIGFLDEDGYLTITDRKKNIIVTAGGKNIAPAPIENRLVSSPLIEQVLIVGDKKNYLSALIVPNVEMLMSHAKNQNINFDNIKELVENPEVIQYVTGVIEKLTPDLAQFEQIKTFKLVPNLFTIEDNELTPTLKIKRKVVEEKYADLIDQMYE
ncbi:long-chain fatty acid--CoA ligase [candidate division KSB1 bacterium]|nr:long-chain fatty acid--CoA ligase [candidate division KSB1 bacterium]MBL7092857.1 long-chain fatty acid--CoA ligase [candidate division KSB1 bacterium]